MARTTRHSRLLATLVASFFALGVVVTGCGGDNKPDATKVTAGSPTTDTDAALTDSTDSTDSTAPAGGQSTPVAPEKGATSNPVASLPPEDQIDYAIKGVLASGAPSLACEQTATENYVKTTFGGRAGCEKSTVPASAATSVAVTGIKISGSKATATARPSDGPSDGETIKVTLVREAGVWKVDGLRSNAPVGP